MSLLENSYFIPYIITVIILFCLYAIVIFFCVNKFRKINKDVPSEDIDYLPLIYAIIIVFFCLGRVFSMIFDITTEFNPDNYNSTNRIIWGFGISFHVLALSVFFLLIEKKVMKGRDYYILFILFFAFYFIGIITINVTFIMIATIFSLYIPIAYLYVALASEGSVRRKGFSVFIGIFLFLLSAFLMGSPIINLLGVETLQMHVYANIVRMVAIVFLFEGFF